MKVTIAILVLTLISVINASSQELGIDTLKIIPNEHNVSWDHVARKLKLTNIQESDNPIEIRLFTKAAISNDGFYKIIYMDKNEFRGKDGQFSIKYSKDFQKIKRIRIKNKRDFLLDDLNTTWTGLIENNITSLPDQDEIQYKMKKTAINEKGEEVIERLIVADGGTYDFEIKIGDKTRFISYSNPCTNAEYYSDIKV
jgi:hypothetical protein